MKYLNTKNILIYFDPLSTSLDI